jgi:hypothetical protein
MRLRRSIRAVGLLVLALGAGHCGDADHAKLRLEQPDDGESGEAGAGGGAGSAAGRSPDQPGGEAGTGAVASGSGRGGTSSDGGAPIDDGGASGTPGSDSGNGGRATGGSAGSGGAGTAGLGGASAGAGVAGSGAVAGGGGAVTSPRNVATVSCGFQHCCAISTSGSVKCWGLNDAGQLGLGDIVGRNGNLGLGTSLPAVDLGTGRTAVSITVGGSSSCAALDDGSVKCWGDNSYGQLGYWTGTILPRGDEPGEMGNALPAAELGTDVLATKVFTSGSSVCAQADTGALKCWGLNASGELGFLNGDLYVGQGYDEMGDSLPFVSLAAGEVPVSFCTGGSTCVLLASGQVRCWGENGAGQLGQTSDIGVRYPSLAGQLPTDLPVVDLGTGRTATSLACGGSHNCVVLDTGDVKCWGDNQFGSLGLGDTQHRGDDPNEMGDDLPSVDLGTGRTALSVHAGFRRTCAVLDDHGIKCWGAAGILLAQGDDLEAYGDEPDEMGDALAAFDLGTGRTISTLSLGGAIVCAVLDDTTLKCWGASGFNGLDSDWPLYGNPSLMGDALPVVDLGF